MLLPKKKPTDDEMRALYSMLTPEQRLEVYRYFEIQLNILYKLIEEE